MSGAICDYFCVSTAKDDGAALMEGLLPVIEAAGGSVESPHLFRFANGGTIKHHPRGPVYVVGTSGAAIAGLKALEMFDRYLWGIVESPPHRVTQMHATMDFPVAAPSVVRSLFRTAVKGGVRLTRKVVKPGHVKKYFGIDARGDETGTVYLGNRTNDVWAKVYDKRHERECAGFPDPGPTLRVEVSIKGKMGVSLRDVSQPDAVFYHYASPDLVQAPDDVWSWVPRGEPLKLPPRRPLLPAQRLMGLVESSSDIRRLLELAEQVGPHGMDLLYRYLDRKRAAVIAPSLATA